ETNSDHRASADGDRRDRADRAGVTLLDRQCAGFRRAAHPDRAADRPAALDPGGAGAPGGTSARLGGPGLSLGSARPGPRDDPGADPARLGALDRAGRPPIAGPRRARPRRYPGEADQGGALTPRPCNRAATRWGV
ncbi:MAG: hypothetical protein AVDCRST_MAG18-4383, partial [uncultured Thermomicrobiales bacterium]